MIVSYLCRWCTTYTSCCNPCLLFPQFGLRNPDERLSYPRISTPERDLRAERYNVQRQMSDFSHRGRWASVRLSVSSSYRRILWDGTMDKDKWLASLITEVGVSVALSVQDELYKARESSQQIKLLRKWNGLICWLGPSSTSGSKLFTRSSAHISWWRRSTIPLIHSRR